MANGVSVGGIESFIKIRDEFTATFAKFEERLSRIESKTRPVKQETDKTEQSFRKLAASLDPVVANEHKLERAQDTLNKALQKGIITQEQYNAQLAKAKSRYSEVHSFTEKLSESLSQKLSGHLSHVTELSAKFGGEAGRAFEEVSGKASGLVSSIAGIGAGLGPLLPVAVAVAAALGGISLAFVAVEKSIDFISDAVQEGVHTQVIIEKLNTALRVNGSASGLSAHQLVEFAESLELVTARGKEEIVQATTILSRYDHLGAESLPRAIRTTLAFAKATGDTAEAAARRLGPALEGNAKSLAGLKDVGIVFTAAQKKTLQQMVETGDRTQYLSTLFDILDEKVGTTSDTFDKNLSKQVKRSQIVFDEFKESIANEVIPALEDLAQDLVDQLGGWENIKKAVKDVGQEVGRVVATIIYALGSMYHEWVASQQIAIANVLDGLHTFAHSALEIIANILEGFSRLPSVLGGGDAWKGPISAVRGFQTASDLALTQAASTARSNASKHVKAMFDIGEAYKKHRLALEGDEEVHKKHGSALDDVAGKESKLQKQLTEVLSKQAEQYRVLAEKSALAAKGPGLDLATRLREEQRINDEHEYRVDLLEQQSKFGEKIGKEIADTNRKLRELGREVEIKLKITTKIDRIDQDKSIEQQFAISNKDLLATLSVMDQNEEAFRKYAQDQHDWLVDYSKQWKDSFKTIDDLAREDMAAIAAAVDEGLLTAEEGEKALAQVREDLLARHLSQWQSFFSTLGGLLGGVFDQIANALNRIQQAQAAGNQLGGMLQGMGAKGGWTSALGMVFAEVQIFYEIYDYFDKLIKRQRGRKFGDLTSVSVEDGKWSAPSYFNEAGREFSKSLRGLLRQILDSIGGVLDDLPKIAIRASNDGKKFSAYIAGVWIGTFSDAQDALEAAVTYAITHATFESLGPEFAQALKASIGATLDELEQNIATATAARRHRLGDVGAQYADLTNEFLSLMRAERELGLSTEATTAAMHRQQDALKASALGLDMSTADRLRDLKSLSDGMGEAAGSLRASMQQQLDDVLAQIAHLEARGPGAPAGTGGGSGAGPGGMGEGGYTKDAQSEWEAAIARLRAQAARYIDELNKIPDALSDTEINMAVFDSLYKYLEGSKKYSEEAHKYARLKVELEFAAIKAQLIALGKWEEFEGMFNDAFAAAQRMAGQGGAGRGGGHAGGDRQSVRDFVTERRDMLATAGMTDFQRALHDLNKEYEDQLKSAGKDAKLRAELLDLQRQQTAQLQQQAKIDLTGKFQSFLGLTTPFDQVRKTAADLIHEIEGSPFGDARKARMIGRVMADVDRQIQALSDQMAAGLFGTLAQYITDDKLHMEALRQQAILNYQLTMETARLEYAKLQAEGKLSPEIKKTFDDIFGWFDAHKADLPGGANWTFTGGTGDGGGPGTGEGYWTWGVSGMIWHTGTPPGGGGDIGDQASSIADAVKRATDLLHKYTDDGLDPLTRTLNEINADFDEITKQLGSTPEIIAEKNKAIDRAMSDAFGGVRDFYNSLLNGPDSHLPVQQQYQAAVANYERILSEVRNKDYSELGDLESALQDAIKLSGDMYDTSTGGFAADRDKMLQELSDLMSGLGIELPSSMSNYMKDAIDNSAMGKLLQFVPPDVNSVSGMMSDGMKPVVDSTNAVANVIEIHGVRQETLLRNIETVLRDFRSYVEQNNLTLGSNIQYGNGTTG